jgi:hypothetical protein
MSSLLSRSSAVPTPFPDCTLERPGVACPASIWGQQHLAWLRRIRRNRQFVALIQLDARYAQRESERPFLLHVGSTLGSCSSLSPPHGELGWNR